MLPGSGKGAPRDECRREKKATINKETKRKIWRSCGSSEVLETTTNQQQSERHVSIAQQSTMPNVVSTRSTSQKDIISGFVRSLKRKEVENGGKLPYGSIPKATETLIGMGIPITIPALRLRVKRCKMAEDTTETNASPTNYDELSWDQKTEAVTARVSRPAGITDAMREEWMRRLAKCKNTIAVEAKRFKELHGRID